MRLEDKYAKAVKDDGGYHKTRTDIFGKHGFDSGFDHREFVQFGEKVTQHVCSHGRHYPEVCAVLEGNKIAYVSTAESTNDIAVRISYSDDFNKTFSDTPVLFVVLGEEDDDEMPFVIPMEELYQIKAGLEAIKDNLGNAVTRAIYDVSNLFTNNPKIKATAEVRRATLQKQEHNG